MYRLLPEWNVCLRDVAESQPRRRVKNNDGRAMGFPSDSDSKESACNAGGPGSIPGLGRSPGEGNGYPFQYSCL